MMSMFHKINTSTPTMRAGRCVNDDEFLDNMGLHRRSHASRHHVVHGSIFKIQGNVEVGCPFFDQAVITGEEDGGTERVFGCKDSFPRLVQKRDFEMNFT